MNRISACLVLALIAFGVPGIAQADPPGIEWQNIYLSYRYVGANKQPGNANGANVPENAVNISYSNGWTYGSNFASFDFEQFGQGDPSVNVTGRSTLGSAEFYGVFRTTLSGNKISGTHDFAFGPVADVGLRLGGDYDVQNDQFGSYKRLLVAGPEFDFAVPKGFLLAAIEVTHEWDTNGYEGEGGATSFNVAPALETAWSLPFSVGPVDLNFTGYANVIGPKGRGYAGDFYHRTEVLAHPKILVDVGHLVGFAPNKLVAGVGYEYWLNKFGDYKPALQGTQEHAVFLEVGYNFD
ncbi:hypothetical protein [Acidiphilium sp.]|uniref:hypothetical protein n=1 Tax=Acidiphilium sp. TaxID=527 RepID=UPI003D053D6F